MQPGTSTIWQGLTPCASSSVPTPSVGRILFHDSADGLLKSKDSSGDVVTIVQTDTNGVIVGPITLRNSTETATNLITLLDGELAIISDTGQLRYGDGVTAGGFAANMASSTTILCPAIGTPVENAARLRALYTEAKSYTPGGSALSAINRVVILLGAGKYDFGTGDGSNHGLELDTEFIDLAGITGNPEDVILTSAIATASRGTVEQTADDVRLSGFTMEITGTGAGSSDTRTAAYFPAASLSNTQLTSVECIGGTSNAMSMRTGVEYAGTYVDTTSGDRSFGAEASASGVFVRCTGGQFSFGSSSTGIASGLFDQCVGGNASFGGSLGVASGMFIRCRADAGGFGGLGGTSSGYFFDCLLETDFGSGVYDYLPENVKRKNGTDDDTQTTKDFTSTYRITWTNPGTDDLMVLNQLKLSNLNTSASTFSVAVSSTNALGCTAGASGVMTPESGFTIPSWWVAGDLVDVTWDDGGPKSRTDVEITTVGATIDLDETTGTGDALPTSGSVTVTGIGELSYNGGALTFSSTKPDTEDKWLVSVPVSLGLIGKQESLHVDIESDNAGDTSVTYKQDITEMAVL